MNNGGNPNPFEAPSVLPTVQKVPRNRQSGRRLPIFIPLGWRTTALSICLGTFILCVLVDAATNWQYVSLAQLAPGPELEKAAAAADRNVVLSAGLRLLSLVVCAVFWSIWVYRSYGNAAAIAGRTPSHSQGWAVGSHFVPFVSLVIPYQVMAESWRRSLGGNAGSRRTDSALLVTMWWSTWLLLAVYGIVLRFHGEPQNLAELETHGYMAAGSGLLAALVGAMALMVVRGVHQRQTMAMAAQKSEDV